jgi:hypothetical protein
MPYRDPYIFGGMPPKKPARARSKQGLEARARLLGRLLGRQGARSIP